MRRTWRGRRSATRTAAAAVETLEGRTLFAAAAALPAAAVAVSPGTAAGTGPLQASPAVTFTWGAVAGVSGYQLHVYDKTSQRAMGFNVSAGATSYAVPSGTLAPTHAFTWYVRDIVGAVAPPRTSGNRLNFRTPSYAGPAAVSPGSAAAPPPVLTTVAPTFRWTAVAGVSGYLLTVVDTTDNATLVSQTLAAGTTSYTPTAGTLVPARIYSWNVRGLVGTVPVGAASRTMNFALPALPAPTVTGPGSADSTGGTVVTTLTPTFTWTPVRSVTGFTAYQIGLYDLTTNTGTTFTARPSAGSFALPAGHLTYGHVYTWNVRLVDGTVVSQQVSAPNYYFTVLKPAKVGSAVVRGGV